MEQILVFNNQVKHWQSVKPIAIELLIPNATEISIDVEIKVLFSSRIKKRKLHHIGPTRDFTYMRTSYLAL